jgi:DNA-binding response OmpR family regulator
VQRRILVAEDDHDLRTAIAEYLRGEGFEVEEAANGRRALEAARTAPPDVLVLDLNMPEVDGSDVLTSWTDDAALRHLPVLLVSSAAELAEVAQQFNVRASLAKPFDMDVLHAVVEQLVAHPEAPAAE